MNRSALQQRARALCSPLAPLPAEKPMFADTRPCREVLQNCRAVLFDVYGTLLISGSGDVGTATATDSAAALNDALHAAGLEGSAETGARGKELLKEEILRHHELCRRCGITAPEVDILEIWTAVTAQLQAEGLLPAVTPEQIPALALEYECRVNPVWPMPGARQAIERVRRSDRIEGIVSNAQFYTPLLLQTLFTPPWEPDPDHCAWSYRLGEAKPSPRLFETVLGTLRIKHGIRPQEVLYVGNDMLNDIFTAARAGCRTALFAGDGRSLRLRTKDDRVRTLAPDTVITGWQEFKTENV